jgi:hypothetical protein
MWLFKKTRREKFDSLFNEKERTAIMNALYRRASDDSDNKHEHLINQNKVIKETCKGLAKELMS